MHSSFKRMCSTLVFYSGFNISLAPMLKEVAASRGVNVRGFTLVHLMSLSDPCDLPELPDNRYCLQLLSISK